MLYKTLILLLLLVLTIASMAVPMDPSKKRDAKGVHQPSRRKISTKTPTERTEPKAAEEAEGYVYCPYCKGEKKCHN
jgi:hypothetical protein